MSEEKKIDARADCNRDSAGKGCAVNGADVAALLEYTALAPAVTSEQVANLCNESLARGFAAVCVNPIYVTLASSLLSSSQTSVGTVVGYPLGALTTRQKVYETATSLEEGALEIDLALNVALLHTGDKAQVRQEILSIAQVLSRNPFAILKVILETSLLNDAQLKLATQLAIEGGAHYVVAARNYGSAAPSTAAVAVLRSAARRLIGVKVSGITTAVQATQFVAAGVARLGSDDPLSLLVR